MSLPPRVEVCPRSHLTSVCLLRALAGRWHSTQPAARRSLHPHPWALPALRNPYLTQGDEEVQEREQCPVLAHNHQGRTLQRILKQSRKQDPGDNAGQTRRGHLAGTLRPTVSLVAVSLFEQLSNTRKLIKHGGAELLTQH